MEVVDQWTGRHACALQAALRMTQDDLASQLLVARRTVATWHEKPEVVLKTDLQRALDTLYERAPEQAKLRFARQLKADDAADIAAAGNAITLTVAIAVVVTDGEALVVCRRDADPSGITWQFPAGIVKPGASASTVAVRETLAETGVHCAVRKQLGSRVHPLTGVYCEYFLCDYLAGEVENRDVSENVSAIWVAKDAVTRFIPADRVFAPVLNALEGDA
jgi:8-oxo-dGTP pyrophosphatase MutT (NUDIX family)